MRKVWVLFTEAFKSGSSIQSFHRAALTPMAISIVILFGLYLRTDELSHDVDGPHIFRQTHVASNIFFYQKEGLRIPGKLFAKNQYYTVFDFPVYQHTVAILSSLLKLPLVLVGRVFNISIYVLTCIVLYRLMRLWSTNNLLVLIVLFLFSTSPLNVFYNRAIIPDNLAVFLSFISLYCFLKWEVAPSSNRTYYYLAMVVTGIISSLIKNPIYLPIFIAILFGLVARRKWRTIPSFEMFLFVLLVFLGVVLFKLYANVANTGTYKTPAYDYYWYFSNLSDRMNLDHYCSLISHFSIYVVNPFFFLLSITGIAVFVAKDRGQYKHIVLGILWGSIITCLVFFNVQWRHNYYQLPFVFIVTFFTGYSLYHICSLLMNILESYIHPGKYIAQASMAILVLFIMVVQSIYGKYRIGFPEPLDLIARGEFIQDNTPPDSFVFYIEKGAGWDPSHLYFSRREGYNVDVSDFSQEYLDDLVDVYKENYSSFYVFSPYSLDDAASLGIASEDESLFQVISLEIASESDVGVLFTLQKQ